MIRYYFYPASSGIYRVNGETIFWYDYNLDWALIHNLNYSQSSLKETPHAHLVPDTLPLLKFHQLD